MDVYYVRLYALGSMCVCLCLVYLIVPVVIHRIQLNLGWHQKQHHLKHDMCSQLPDFKEKKIIIKLLDQTLILACRFAYVEAQQKKLGI